MKNEPLCKAERDYLLQLARQSIANRVSGQRLPGLQPVEVPERLQRPGATFVTLTIDGELRGCVGALEAYQPLVDDVWEHAEAAAFHDYRFPPLQSCELPLIRIEISYLTEPELLEYEDPNELCAKLRPDIDGVLIRDGFRRATFLPQVWEKLPDADEFLEHLCMKMGAPRDYWRRKKLDVYTYQVESFEEEV